MNKRQRMNNDLQDLSVNTRTVINESQKNSVLTNLGPIDGFECLEKSLHMATNEETAAESSPQSKPK